MNTFLKLLRLVKIEHTLFSLPFVWVGFVLGIRDGGVFSWLSALWVFLALLFARNAAMSFNRWADRHIDKRNSRTQAREIPSGQLSAGRVFVFAILNSALFIIVSGLLNPLCLYLSPVVLLIVLGYSYTKRFSSLCHFFLSLGIALAPIGAYLAVTQSFHILPVLFGGVIFTWISGFDILYALQDEGFDREEGLYSMPVLLGTMGALLLSALLHLLTVITMWLIGQFWIDYPMYWVGMALFSVLLLYEHLLIGKGNLEKIDLAFGVLNAVGGSLYGLAVIVTVW